MSIVDILQLLRLPATIDRDTVKIEVSTNFERGRATRTAEQDALSGSPDADSAAYLTTVYYPDEKKWFHQILMDDEVVHDIPLSRNQVAKIGRKTIRVYATYIDTATGHLYHRVAELWPGKPCPHLHVGLPVAYNPKTAELIQ